MLVPRVLFEQTLDARPVAVDIHIFLLLLVLGVGGDLFVVREREPVTALPEPQLFLQPADVVIALLFLSLVQCYLLVQHLELGFNLGLEPVVLVLQLLVPHLQLLQLSFQLLVLELEGGAEVEGVIEVRLVVVQRR